MPIQRERGVAMILMIFMGLGLMILAAVSVDLSLVHSTAERVQKEVFTASQIAESAAAHALVHRAATVALQVVAL